MNIYMAFMKKKEKKTHTYKLQCTLKFIKDTFLFHGKIKLYLIYRLFSQENLNGIKILFFTEGLKIYLHPYIHSSIIYSIQFMH